MGKRFDIASADNPAVAAQKQLSERFGIEGNPTVLLVAGDERTVLTRTEALTGALDALRRKGKIRSVFSPTGLLPSPATQTQRAAGFAGTDLESSARALEAALHENGLASAPHRAFIERLRQLGDGSEIVTLAQASEMLPSGLLDNSLRRLSDGSYVAAIAYYSTSEGDAAIPDSTINSWRSQFGPFIEFSFDKMSRDLQARILHDSRKALLWTALGLVLIIYLTFRNLRDMLLVLMPIIFAIVTTFGLLALVGHRFSFMCITAIPLILGIGIDNGIHVVRRYREREGQTIVDVARDSGAAVIQSNLTTMIGFGALMASGFAPLAELGRVTCLGVALALAGGLWLLPSVLSLMEGRNRLANSKAVAKATQAT
jgi:predicted RND superfamily exporter protein